MLAGREPTEVVRGRPLLPMLGLFFLRLIRMEEARPRLPSEFRLAAFPLLPSELEDSRFLSLSMFLNQELTFSLNLLEGEGLTQTTVPVSED